MAWKGLAGVAVVAVAVAIASCSTHADQPASTSSSTTSSTSGSGAAGAATMFRADAPEVYVAKVKNILIGKPPTDAEIQQVKGDPAPPAQLKSLIGTWMQDPAYDEKMQVFFSLAFQQTQLTTASFIDMLPPDGIGIGEGVPFLLQNASESFARTMIALTKQGKPLNQAMTTTSFMMTPALMELYAFLDEHHVDDVANVTDALKTDYPDLKNIVQGTAGLSGVTLAQSADPTNTADFMRFYNAGVAGLTYDGNDPNPTCDGLDPITYPANAFILHWIMYGAVFNHKGPNGNCGSRSTGKGTMMFAPTDFTAWQMVTVRAPSPGEQTTRFFDVPHLRTATELVLRTPRVGYFSTPAFFANWSTNTSNQMRVTANQALIVATGKAVDGTDATMAPLDADGGVPALDQAHTGIGNACFGCHQILDPTRAILSSTWTYAYYTQEDAQQIAQKGEFAFQNVIDTNIGAITDFANTLATHPLLPGAWVEKLCYYANSQPCLPTDPEYLRIVKLFQTSNLSWTTLVTELLASPITTNAVATQTTDASEIVAVSRRDHLCAALDNRLRLTDVCGLQAGAQATRISTIVAGLPSDGYGRGSPVPVLPNAPTLFYRGGLENICGAVAAMLIDNKNAPKGAMTWTSSATPDAAIADFVSILMAIEPSDARSAPLAAALKAHFTQATAPPYSASNSVALQSTFTAACLAPSSVAIGM